MWMSGGYDSIGSRGLPAGDHRASDAFNVGMEARAAVRELAERLERLSILNQALWELLRDRLQVSDAELEQRVAAVDLRDGVQDGKITSMAVRCPGCQRVNNSRHAKCLYCGLLFEKPMFG